MLCAVPLRPNPHFNGHDIICSRYPQLRERKCIEPPKNATPLKVQDLKGLFLVVGGMISLAMLWFAIKLLYNYIKQGHPQARVNRTCRGKGEDGRGPMDIKEGMTKKLSVDVANQ